MKKNFLIALAVGTLLTACSQGVPAISDPHAPNVDGKTMTPKDFLTTYCVGKSEISTCESVKNAMSKDATKGALPKGW